MTRKLLLYLCFLLFIPLVSSQPPFQGTTISNDVLEIDFPKIDIFKFGNDLQFNFHIFNSTGVLLLNDTTSCIFHLFNFTGHHIIEEPLVFDVAGNDFFFNINSANLSVLGDYSLLVRCNNTDNQGGFISKSFKVTPSGFTSELSSLSLILYMIIIILFFASISFFSSKLGVKLFGYGVSMAMIVLAGFLVYMKESGFFINVLLFRNFWLILILIFGIAIISLTFFMFRLMNPGDDLSDEEGGNRKW